MLFSAEGKKDNMQRIGIADGINFGYLPQTKFKTNFFEVCFVLDLEKEYTTKLSLLSGVLLRASKRYPGIAEINNRLDYLYDMNVSMRTFKRGERLILCYECDYLRDSFLPDKDEKLTDKAIEMFYELVFNPYIVDGGFDKKILDSEKTDLENTIKSIINYKNSYAKEKCIESLCEGERFSINEQGCLEDIPAVSEKSLYDFYKFVLSSARVEIFFCGETDTEKVCSGFKEIFSSIERKPLSLSKTFISGTARDTVRQITEKMPVTQGKLALGFKTGVEIGDEDSVAMSLLCEIYGGSPMSKLFMNVREKLSLCYFCRAVADSYKGIMLVLSGIQSENKEKAQAAILSELSDIQNGVVSQDEFEAARLSLINSYKTLEDSQASLATWFMSRIICDNFMSPDAVVEKLKSISFDEVIAVSKKIKLDTVYFLEGVGEECSQEEA